MRCSSLWRESGLLSLRMKEVAEAAHSGAWSRRHGRLPVCGPQSIYATADIQEAINRHFPTEYPFLTL